MRAPVFALVVATGLAVIGLGRASGVRAGRPRRGGVLEEPCRHAATPPPRSRRASWAAHRADRDRRVQPLRRPPDRFQRPAVPLRPDRGGARRRRRRQRAGELGRLGWWQVMKYWRSLYDNEPNDKLEVRGYRDASTLTQEMQTAALLRTSAARLLRLADTVTDPDEREMLREAALRAAVVDTSWSAAFVSYVIRQSGVAAERVPVRQRPSRLYLRRVRRERGRAGQGSRRPALSCVSARHDQTARRRSALPAPRTRARRRQRRGGARAHPRGTRRRRRGALGPAHPLRGGRACRCAGAQDVHHRRQRQSVGHRPEAEPQARPEVLGRAEGPLRRRGPLDPAAARRRHAARTGQVLAQRQELVRAAAGEVRRGVARLLRPSLNHAMIQPENGGS